MNGISISAISVSALLLYLAYTFTGCFYWCTFLFLLPLFYVSRLRFSDGLFWGIFFYSTHFFTLASLIYERGQGDYRLLVYVLLIFFCALHSALWFFIVDALERVVSIAPVRPLITFGYFVWMQTTVFWVFDIWEGYPFALPIIPLAYHTSFMRMLPWMGVYGLTACLIGAQWFAVRASQLRSLMSGTIAVLLYAPFFIGYFLQKPIEDLPLYMNNLIYLEPIQEMRWIKNPLDGAQEITYVLQHGVEQYRGSEYCYIMPESAYPFCLEEYQYRLWQLILDHNEQQMILGTHKKHFNKGKNILLHLNQCRIIQTYEKTHSTPLTERIPYCLNNYELFNLFGGKTDRSKYNSTRESIFEDEDTPDTIRNLSTTLIRINNYYFLPVLCSELFFNDFSFLPLKKVPLLLLCNDGWFNHYYARSCMFLYAKIYAILWQRAIVYISHTHGLFISQTGSAVALRRVRANS